MKSQEYTAKSVDLAIEEGLADLGMSREQVEVEIVNKGGLLSKAKVVLTVKETPGMRAQSFLNRVLEIMGVTAVVELDDAEEEAVLEITGTDSAKLFGHHGETIDALQYLSSLIANADGEDYRRIVLDSENYRQMRQERLERIADSMAAKALDRGYRIKLDPMNPFERRVIHTHLAENKDVETRSEGEEPNRYVVIAPVGGKAARYEPKEGEEATSDYSNRPRKDGKYHGSHDAPRSYGDRNRGNRNGGRGGYNRSRGGRDDRRGGYNRDRSHGGRDDRPPKPPRAKSTFIGTILTTPMKPAEDDTPTEE